MSATELPAAGGTDEETTAATDDAPDDAQVEAARAEAAEGPRDAAPEPAALEKDVLFDILKNERRRRALDFLRDTPTTTLSDLAEHVASLENDKPVRELTSSERKRVYVGLYQCHLPKMADAGVIDYDRSRGTIELREAASSCFVYLDIEPGDGPDGDAGIGGRVYSTLTSLSTHFRR